MSYTTLLPVPVLLMWRSFRNGVNMQGQQLSAAAQHAQPPANWLGQGAPTPASFPNAQMPNGGQIPSNAPIPQGTPVNNASATLQPHGHMPQHAPPRSGPTPLQHTMVPNGIHGSPNMSASPANSIATSHTPQPTMSNGVPQQSQAPNQQPQRLVPQRSLPALPREAFEDAYRQWCSKRNVHEDDQLLQIEGKRIDLHRLHQEVIAAGTIHKVSIERNGPRIDVHLSLTKVMNNLDAWAIIGGRLDFVQFPATKDEPAKSGPGVAQKLQHVYKEYLLLFDQTYLRSVLAKQMNAAHQRGNPTPSQGPLPPPAGGSNVSMPNGPSNGGPGGAPQQPTGALDVRNLASLLGTNDSQRISQMLHMSFMPSEELRKRGIPNDIINTIDTHRAILNRFAQAQSQFRNAIKNGQNPNQLFQGQRPNGFGPQLRNPAQGSMVAPPGMPGKLHIGESVGSY